MSYSCTDFTDSILDALKIELQPDQQDSPSDQADLALAEIERLQRIAGPAGSWPHRFAPAEVVVFVKGGVVQHVEAPAGVVVKIIDYDVDSADVAELDMHNGEDCRIATWGA